MEQVLMEAANWMPLSEEKAMENIGIKWFKMIHFVGGIALENLGIFESGEFFPC